MVCEVGIRRLRVEETETTQGLPVPEQRSLDRSSASFVATDMENDLACQSMPIFYVRLCAMIALADCDGTLFITSGRKLAIKPAQDPAVDFGVSPQRSC